ncbi:hypothetical protein I314_05733 [Cryptococcus bacillisporus CA1873]|uniref:Uncharacterized protein n=1 Tax=Cryptococcus bacillisporus CA1873 TaxID=1296111 RepID=A0ABR5B4H9_CRYGA|nr:hypothetical protein I314_05733 [Cryptococcus bacillisporus CA1873]|eukprot:KIR58488.1 hypothetical protein I314_05733 [Cryptococcus gattii CA1873]
MGEATQYNSRDKRQTAQKIHRGDRDELGGGYSNRQDYAKYEQEALRRRFYRSK